MINNESTISISKGNPFPFGHSEHKNGLNFAVYINHVEKVFLSFFHENQTNVPFIEFELDPEINCTGNVWHAKLENLPPFTLYAYRVCPKTQDLQIDTPKDKNIFLVDPYAKCIVSHPTWGSLRSLDEPYHALGKVVSSDYDWEGDVKPHHPFKDIIIYEMHVRGFTQHASSQVTHPGTFAGLTDKISYFKELGVNAIELLPVFEFNECENLLINPTTHERLVNYFGYSTVNFFSLMNRYMTQPIQDKGLTEFKDMVKLCHKNGIEVILDVVYNHTFEGNQLGPTVSFRGFDPYTYYMIDKDNNYLNFSGCGNTLNCNHPITAEMILNSLRYWVTEMHVDGFRFDLASILVRAENGAPIPNAPLIEAISKDPILAQTKLIAEAWDAGGLYQVGGFYPGTRWSEWNGKYRDVVRRFIKGTPGHKTEFATALSGSQDLYGWRGSPVCSINFITAHDGFSLADLVTFEQKKNLDNGENNRDGFDYNDSWNCGIEGHSGNKKIVFLRERQIRNFALALLMSQGIPMLCMGDEYAHSRHGNNNTWCQDNELNWFLWDHLEKRPGFFRFVKGLIAFRKSEPLLRREHFLSDQDVTWHGNLPNTPDWEKDNGLVAFSLNDAQEGPQIYAVFNAFHAGTTINLPLLNPEYSWYWVANTFNPAPEDYYEEDQRKKLEFTSLRIPAYAAYIFKAVKKNIEIFPQPEKKQV